MWVLDGDPGKAASPAVPGARGGTAAWWSACSVLPSFGGGEEGKKCQRNPWTEAKQNHRLESTLLRERSPSLSRQRQDLRDSLEVGLPSVEGSAPSSPFPLLEGARMDKGNWGDAATSEARECSNALIKTTQSSQRNVFSIKTKQRQRLSCARPGCSQRSSSEEQAPRAQSAPARKPNPLLAAVRPLSPFACFPNHHRASRGVPSKAGLASHFQACSPLILPQQGGEDTPCPVQTHETCFPGDNSL